MNANRLLNLVKNRPNSLIGRMRARIAVRRRMRRLKLDNLIVSSPQSPLNIIVITIDCLRGRQLSCLGHHRQTTPFLDTFDQRSVAISAATWTYPSVTSMLTGLYPHNHGAFIPGKVKDFGNPREYRRMHNRVIALPEILRFLGYEVCFSTAIYLAFAPLRARVVPRLHRPSANAEDLFHDILRWIDGRKRSRFFAYVHLADLHTPLNPPRPFRDHFGKVKPLRNIDMWDFVTRQQQTDDIEGFTEYKEARELLYDNTLRGVDHTIELFIRDLEARGLKDSTAVLVTADHGEEFWEHAELEAGSFYVQSNCHGFGHGHTPFNELIEVPLLINGPVPQTDSDARVSTVDIVPTVLELLGIEHKMRFDGVNVFQATGNRPLLSEASGIGYEKKALIMGRYKLIYSEEDGVEWVFDLEKDPEEQHPITDKQITSVFVDKLHSMIGDGERARIRQVAKGRGDPGPSTASSSD
jgi:arylsulfatase A-like enzyme